MARAPLLAVLLIAGAALPARAEEPHRLHAEVDPLPFALGGYGGQVGYRAAALPRLRIALASFALEVPDAVAQLDDDNDGFHVRVRPSGALYLLYFLSGSRGGWVAGGSLRVLRLAYSHDGAPGETTRLRELSIEAIGGYKWHPWDAGFYLQPWVTIARAVHRTGDAVVGGREYQQMFLQLFATVNLGWELAL
ncbi:MAG TPA: hypothetical protein VFU21_12970 [Kofleriaceae bacterium]|nr:hypothetical protein [Kofleriaceae bacterium]